ncbi:MAG: hypothetical protein ACK4TP_10205 [Hyphomicrobium sp.]
MDATAKRELASAITETMRIHEESYTRRDSGLRAPGYYALNWRQSAERATQDPDLVDLLSVLCMSGFADVPEWAERVLAVKQAA